MKFFPILVLTAVLVAGCGNRVQDSVKTDETVLVSGFGHQITVQEIEWELRNLSNAQRDKLFKDPKELERLIGLMLFHQKMVDAANDEGLLDDEYEYVLARDRQRTIARRLTSNKYNAVEVPDLSQEARAYYDENPEEFIREPRVRVSNIMLQAPTPEEKIRRRPEIENILKQLKQGAEFGRIASENSEDFTRYSAGELGFIKQGDKDEAFDKAAFALKEVGDISDIVESTHGLHIIQLLEKGPEINIEFKYVEKEIIEYLEEKYRSSKVQEWIEGVAPPESIEINKDIFDQWWENRYANVDQSNIEIDSD